MRPVPCPICRGREGSELLLRCDAAPAATEAIRTHEAAHGVAAVALGGSVHFVRARRGDAAAAISMTAPVIELGTVVAAGWVAQNWLRRWVRGLQTDELIAAFDRVGAGMAGGCDQCKLAGLCYVGPSDDAVAEAVALHRRAEQRAVDLVRTGSIWRAIREVAAALAPTGEIDGATAHGICAGHFEAGSFSILNAN